MSIKPRTQPRADRATRSLVALLITLNCFDAFASLYTTDSGTAEYSPLWEWAIQASLLGFLLAKSAVVAGLALLVYRSRSKVRSQVLISGLSVAVLAYAFLGAYQVLILVGFSPFDLWDYRVSFLY